MASTIGKRLTIPIKPLSVNEAWQGRRFKTDKYKSYEKSVLFVLPKGEIEKGVNLTIVMEFGFSSSGGDIDNPIKLILDILQKKYGFNDSQIFELLIRKRIVKKGNEYSKVLVEPSFEIDDWFDYIQNKLKILKTNIINGFNIQNSLKQK